MGAPADATIEIALANDIREIASAAAHIDEFCTRQELAPDVAYSVNPAVEEILNNTVHHGYEDDEPHRIEVIVRLEATTLVVMIVDDGKEFDPTKVEGNDITASADDQELGGPGLPLVNRMMDILEYQRRGGCNLVILSREVSEQTPATVDNGA